MNIFGVWAQVFATSLMKSGVKTGIGNMREIAIMLSSDSILSSIPTLPDNLERSNKSRLFSFVVLRCVLFTTEFLRKKSFWNERSKNSRKNDWNSLKRSKGSLEKVKNQQVQQRSKRLLQPASPFERRKARCCNRYVLETNVHFVSLVPSDLSLFWRSWTTASRISRRHDASDVFTKFTRTTTTAVFKEPVSNVGQQETFLLTGHARQSSTPNDASRWRSRATSNRVSWTETARVCSITPRAKSATSLTFCSSRETYWR